MIKFEVRQQIGTVNKKWMEPVSEGSIERLVRQDYERLKAEYPGEYFELVKIEIQEECLDFTAKQE